MVRLPGNNGNIGRADNEVKDLMPHDAHSAENDLDELLTTIGMRGIDVLEERPTLSSLAIDKEFRKEVEAGEGVELDLTPGALEKSNDPVRIYLREMGMTPLLTREGEALFVALHFNNTVVLALEQDASHRADVSHYPALSLRALSFVA